MVEERGEEEGVGEEGLQRLGTSAVVSAFLLQDGLAGHWTIYIYPGYLYRLHICGFCTFRNVQLDLYICTCTR